MAGDFVGVMDSGLGGISVLRELVRELPHEDFRFFGDSAHNPYGEKTDEQVRALTGAIVDRMVSDGAKAVVIACNTATSAAVAGLRERYDLPIIGVEPALKPACEALPGGTILVMATPVTLRLDKFQQLEHEYDQANHIIAAPCPGLAGRIEQGNLDAPDLHELLESLVGQYAGSVDGVVLGCTHYPFVRRRIAEVLGDVRFFDGSVGTARQTRRLIAARGELRESGTGTVVLQSSIDTPEEIALYQRFLTCEM